jgi:anti-sigma regulatory factor (Ser/Thr protein kinase)
MGEPSEMTSAEGGDLWRMVIKNDLAAVGVANHAFETFLRRQGIEPEVVFTSALALEEILTNIIKYGYDDDGVHEISAEVRLLRDELILRVVDDGHEFDPGGVPPPDLEIPLEERPIGGLGIHLLVNLAQRLTYARVGGENVLTLSFTLKPLDG